MEFSENLQTLIERAWALHECISDEINSNSTLSFCRLCSEHGLCCGIAVTSFEERERLIAIRDSLKDVENNLIFLQRLQSWHPIDRQEARTHLEESRLALTEKVTQHQGREIDAIKELKASFGNGKTAFNWELKDPMEKKAKSSAAHNGIRQISGLIICCIRTLFNPWKWQKASRLTVKLIVASASISSTIHFYRTRQQQYSNSQRKVLSFVNSAGAGREDDFPLTTISKSPLDVLYGKG